MRRNFLATTLDVFVTSDVVNEENKGKSGGYVLLKCRSCSAEIGRIYKQAAGEMDRLRDLFALNVQSVESYEFGSACQFSQMSAQATRGENRPSQPEDAQLKTAGHQETLSTPK
eukprot:m.71554 g.71554  ORF g.71554 m.71554 type:complete len:114 (+) comp35745_c0_seq14:293-634(+)